MLVDREEYEAEKVITCPRCKTSWCKKCNKTVPTPCAVPNCRLCQRSSARPIHECESGDMELQRLMDEKGWMSCPGMCSVSSYR